MLRSWVVRVRLFLCIRHDGVPFFGNANAHQKDIPFLEGDATLLGNFQNVREFDLVGGKGGILDSLFLCPASIVDQDSAS